MNNAQYWINTLKMEKHPEGGYYKEIYKSDIVLKEGCLPSQYSDRRICATSIFYLLPHNESLKFHQLRSDEIWYFHFGSGVSIHCINPDGSLETLKLGLDHDAGEKPQIVLKAGTIFKASVGSKNLFTLVGCMVSPGFIFDDLKIYAFEELIVLFPQHEDFIRSVSKA
ncbi:MAG: cupin domain-containing protein [Bacteroidales bacterium]|nr:cupin domain-containing protein [Bacteroidales bacterium]